MVAIVESNGCSARNDGTTKAARAEGRIERLHEMHVGILRREGREVRNDHLVARLGRATKLIILVVFPVEDLGRVGTAWAAVCDRTRRIVQMEHASRAGATQVRHVVGHDERSATWREYLVVELREEGNLPGEATLSGNAPEVPERGGDDHHDIAWLHGGIQHSLHLHHSPITVRKGGPAAHGCRRLGEKGARIEAAASPAGRLYDGK